MRQRRLVQLVAPVVVGGLVLAACGTKKEDTGSGNGGGDKIAKIGVIAPLSGDLSALGLGIKNGVDLAIKQANEAKKVPGWTLQIAPEDDTATANVGAQVAAKLKSDAAVVGVVGTLNSSVAEQVAPVLQSANIVQISPANTGVKLTGRDKLPNQQRVYSNYFRVATTDDVQGPFAAQYLYSTGVKKLAIVHDKKTYGQGLATAVQAEFTKQGGTVTGTETVNPGDKLFSGVVTKILQGKPDAVYYGGEFPEAAPLSKQLHDAGFTGPVMGGDGIYSQKFIDNGGHEADLATSVGAPTESLASAKAFVDAYKAAGYAEPYEAYGAYAYDAANVIIEALAKTLNGKDKIDDQVRKDVITAVQGVTISGVTGQVAFDQFGDTTTKVLTVYTVQGKKWVAKKTDTFK
ncbi:MAG TPA: branched-chain amino acid ABC transporter substrate-binding protein [Mycobacteriales bacterium]|nr:branched-chain amino acid ABC transporter substrate-binding protein [Mycobacteriales bacterium]